jgi:two-component system phosphate regulon sensor histidine kinase PhoR
MDVGTLGVAVLGLAAAATLGLAVGVLAGRSRADEARQRAASAASELARRETSAREQRAVQDLILASMQEGVLLLDQRLETAFANAALERHLGARPASAAQLYPIDVREIVRRVASSSEPATVEVERSAPARWLRVTAAPAGEGAVLVVVTDVTDARRLERVRRDFVANASHELKTPAASIQAAAETLLAVARDDPSAVPRFASQLEREAVRLSRIVADLLDLSRLESGSELPEPVRLDVIAREEAERAGDRAVEAGVDVEVVSAGPVTVDGGARDLSLLVRNLIDNAIRHTGAGGRVTVDTLEQAGRVTLTVTDTGVGIPARDLPRIFERFYRVDRARSRETGGTGLGLSIVRHVAENHRGSVAVTSELGTGSSFVVTLPAATSAADDSGPPRSRPAAEDSAG